MSSYPRLERIDKDARLYVINYGSHVSCIGWDKAETDMRAFCAWVGMLDVIEPRGTQEHYAAYAATIASAQRYAAETGARCNAFLIPELIGREGLRVEVTYPGGERKRFKVGKSTGWAPCHLELHNKRSHGGSPVHWPKGTQLTQVIR